MFSGNEFVHVFIVCL